MIDCKPEVFCIGEPVVDTEQMLLYLVEVGGQEWYERVFLTKGEYGLIPAAEALTEFMGRLCYRSWSPGLNQNVTKVREDRGDYLLNVLRSGHGSVLEHCVFNFVIHNGTRVFTAEMNRHKAGTAISEQSLRYVRLDKDIPFRLPHGVLSEESLGLMKWCVEVIEDCVGKIYEQEGIETAEDFATKKTVTSAVRRVAPMGMCTEEGWSANVRAIRHVIEMRTEKFAEEEIRDIVGQIGAIMQQRCPLLFGDYVVDEIGQYVTENRKV